MGCRSQLALFGAWLDDSFFGAVDSRVYTSLRVVLASVSFVNWLCLLPVVDSMFLESGGFPRHTPLRTRPYSLFYFLSDETIQLSFGFVPLVILGLLVGGRLARPCVILLWLWTLSYNNYSKLHTVGWDVVLRSALFLLVVSPLGSPLFHSLRFGPSQSATPALTSPRYGLVLQQIQVAIVYLATAWHKLPASEWREGTVMSYFFASTYSTVAGTWVADFPVTLAVVTYVTLLIEICLPFLLLRRSTRALGFLLGFGLHLGIAATSHLLLFSVVMLSTYVAFLDGRDLDRCQLMLKRLRKDKRKFNP